MNIEALREQYTAHRTQLKNIKESFVDIMPEHLDDQSIIDWASRHLQSQRNVMIKDVDTLTVQRLEIESLKESKNEQATTTTIRLDR